MNLLNETIQFLQEFGKSPDDVEWVGSKSYGWSSWDDFAAVADVEYDDGYGAQEIAQDLLIVGNDWWMTRYEYDGNECWDFHTMPERPAQRRPLKHVKVWGDMIGWRVLSDLNS